MVAALPQPIADLLRPRIGELTHQRPIGGGDISQTVMVKTSKGLELLIKWHHAAPVGMFSAEAVGLRLLAETRTVRVPEVMAYAEPHDREGCPGFIALEWLGQGGKTAEAAQMLGVALAQLHAAPGAGCSYGLDEDNFIGANPQQNGWCPSWVDFFREKRLRFQMALAIRNGLLPRARQQRLERLMDRLQEWLPLQPRPSLLHGDLWGGNWIVTGSGEPALIDPAVYYGHNEAEIAFTRLFGGFPMPFYHAYFERLPSEPGFEERVDIYNLYHLLNHLNLFGEGYGASIDAILKRYGN